MADSVLHRLRQLLPGLSAAEARVAHAIMDDPKRIVDLTITELAKECGTSQATVARFCQTIGYSGYRDFRLELASATSREQAERDRFSVADGQIDLTDSTEDVIAKIAYQEVRAIEDTAKALDPHVLDSAVGALTRAKRIDIVGYGSSGLTAADLQQKLNRIGLPTQFFADPHVGVASAALQGPGGVVVGISHSGLTIDTVNALEIARKAGATTVGITNFPDSPLAERCDFVLTTQATENRYRSGAMSSRTAQLAVVDFLFVRIAQERYGDVTEALRRTYDAVQSQRLPAERRRNGKA